jgi:hypothetical protein
MEVYGLAFGPNEPHGSKYGWPRVLVTGALGNVGRFVVFVVSR